MGLFSLNIIHSQLLNSDIMPKFNTNNIVSSPERDNSVVLEKLQVLAASNLYNLHPRQATTIFYSNRMSQGKAGPNYLQVHLG